MALVRWDPVRDLEALQSDMNRLFGSFFQPAVPGNGNGNGSATRRWVPAMDLVETDSHLVLRADLPGLSEDDVEIEVKDNTLVVAGQRKAEHEEKSEGYYRVERSFGAFSRALTLPDGVDADNIDASFDRGVLEVRIPKPEERKPRRISIGRAREALDGKATEKAEK